LENTSSYENPILLPLGVVRFLLTRRDVLHSLGVPSLGVKLDSIPGRLNFTTVEMTHMGLN
jgi:heme/copper-type cytochrome/quinol oxidase subunit 2